MPDRPWLERGARAVTARLVVAHGMHRLFDMTNVATNVELIYRTLGGEDASLRRADVDELRARVRRGVLTAGDPGYEDGRRIWNAMVEHRPAIIARCGSSRDVSAAIEFAREHEMLVSVHGGGHHIAGNAVAEASLCIDLSPMRDVRVDVDQRRARAGGGALLGDVDHETQAFGLATPLGINSTTGLGGLCLGGGFGWLTRKYGMTIDNLVSADVVGADGVLRVASSTSEPDLFWAIRGGGGNFGVVTSFELQLHAVGPLVHSGVVVYPAAQARDVLRRWRDITDSAPEELSSWLVLRRAPPLPFLRPDVHGTDVVIVPILYAGPADQGPAVTAPLTTLGNPIAVMLGAQPYEQFQQAFDPLLAPGARNYWKSSDFEELSDEALDAFVHAARAVPGAECEVFVAHLGGAMARVPADATAYVGRNARYVMNVHGRWRSPTDDELVRAWARGVFDSVARFATGGGYVNFFTADEGARVESAYGANYERLAALKERFDPENLFRMNHNIAPRRASGRPRRGPGAARGAPSGR